MKNKILIFNCSTHSTEMKAKCNEKQLTTVNRHWCNTIVSEDLSRMIVTVLSLKLKSSSTRKTKRTPKSGRRKRFYFQIFEWTLIVPLITTSSTSSLWYTYLVQMNWVFNIEKSRKKTTIFSVIWLLLFSSLSVSVRLSLAPSVGMMMIHWNVVTKANIRC